MRDRSSITQLLSFANGHLSAVSIVEVKFRAALLPDGQRNRAGRPANHPKMLIEPIAGGGIRQEIEGLSPLVRHGCTEASVQSASNAQAPAVLPKSEIQQLRVVGSAAAGLQLPVNLIQKTVQRRQRQSPQTVAESPPGLPQAGLIAGVWCRIRPSPQQKAHQFSLPFHHLAKAADPQIPQQVQLRQRPGQLRGAHRLILPHLFNQPNHCREVLLPVCPILDLLLLHSAFPSFQRIPVHFGEAVPICQGP